MTKELEKTGVARTREIELLEPVRTVVPAGSSQERRDRTIASLRLLWNERSFFWRIVGLGFVTATVIAFLIPNKYTSTTRLMPPDQSAGSGLAMLAGMAGKSASASLGDLGGELLGLKTTGDLFAGVLHSQTVEDDVILKFDLRKIYRDKLWEDARKRLSENTSISIDEKSGIMSIAVTDKSPQRAAAIAQEYVAVLNRTVTDLNTSSAHRERVFLQGRLAQVQQNLESAEKQFSQFASKNTAIDIEEQGKAMIQAGANLEGQLIAAQTELEGLRQIFTDNNVRVRETQARIDEIRRQLQKLGGTAPASSKGKPGPVADASSLYPPIRELPILGVTYADLYRQTKVQEAVFEVLTQEYELAKVEEAKETPSVKVLDPANIPEKKSAPHRLLTIFAGTFLAATFGIAWVFGSAKWQEIDEKDPGKLLAQEVFSSVRKHVPLLSRNGSSGVRDHGDRTRETE